MYVMVNGLPGNMASKVAEYIVDSDDLQLWGCALTGPETQEEYFRFGGVEVALVKPHQREEVFSDKKPDIAVDYTHPVAVNSNADLYCRNGLNFVVGTTGGNREKLEQRVMESDVVAVIAPNMAKQIVALQSELHDFALSHKNGLEGCGLYVRESHQGPDQDIVFRGKADTSGTAKAFVRIFNYMGIPYEESDIAKIREWEDQQRLGVPESARYAHAHHKFWVYCFVENASLGELEKSMSDFLTHDTVFKGYKFDGVMKEGSAKLSRISPDETALFQIETCFKGKSLKIITNINGRDIYAEGTLEAIRFLMYKVADGERGRVYSMMDVLRAE